MKFADYIIETQKNAIKAIESGNYDAHPDYDYYDIYDALWVDDSVTGNGSGSYTFSAWKAAENISGLIWDDEFLSALHDICMTTRELVELGPEAVDVTARCMALGCCVDAIEDAWRARLVRLATAAA